MKWNIFVGSMVLSASLCGQSFGGELLHRLLGGHGVGANSSCCDTTIADPSCGAEMASGCGAGPTCGAEINGSACGLGAPTCGAEISACDPCGAAPACDGIRGFGIKKHGGLLSKLFKHKSGCDVACDAAPAGCSSCGSAPVAAPAMAPAPVVDPHAYLNTNRRVIQASSTRVR